MDHDPHTLAKLARALAINIKTRPQIRSEFAIDEEELQQIEQLDFFKRAFEACVIEWNKPLSTAERVKLKMQAMVEETQPVLARRMMDPKEPLAATIDAAKFAASVGGLSTTDKPAAGAAADKFIITINLGADQIETYEKQLTIEQKVIDDPTNTTIP